MKYLLELVVISLFVSCGGGVPSSVMPSHTELCDPMCQHLAQLKCSEAEAVYNNDLPGPVDVPNETCTIFCQKMQNKGVQMAPKCVLQITSCEGIESARQLDPETCSAQP